MEELKKQAEAYVKEKADALIKGMESRNELTTKESTCDAYNWDQTYHRMFPKIAQELRNRGLTVASKVNWGVTDWYISI